MVRLGLCGFVGMLSYNIIFRKLGDLSKKCGLLHDFFTPCILQVYGILF